MNLTDQPLAIPGLRSYRYFGRFGWVMIGAKNTRDALHEAERSITDLPIIRNLEVWDGEMYVPVKEIQ